SELKQLSESTGIVSLEALSKILTRLGENMGYYPLAVAVAKNFQKIPFLEWSGKLLGERLRHAYSICKTKEDEGNIAEIFTVLSIPSDLNDREAAFGQLRESVGKDASALTLSRLYVVGRQVSSEVRGELLRYLVAKGIDGILHKSFFQLIDEL